MNGLENQEQMKAGNAIKNIFRKYILIMYIYFTGFRYEFSF